MTSLGELRLTRTSDEISGSRWPELALVALVKLPWSPLCLPLCSLPPPSALRLASSNHSPDSRPAHVPGPRQGTCPCTLAASPGHFHSLPISTAVFQMSSLHQPVPVAFSRLCLGPWLTDSTAMSSSQRAVPRLRTTRPDSRTVSEHEHCRPSTRLRFSQVEHSRLIHASPSHDRKDITYAPTTRSCLMQASKLSRTTS